MGAQNREGTAEDAWGDLAGAYSARSLADGGTVAVTVTGDPAYGLTWRMISATGQVWAGSLEDANKERDGNRVFSGWFEPDGAEDNGWAELQLKKQNGTWSAVMLEVWQGGRPASPHRGKRWALTKQ